MPGIRKKQVMWEELNALGVVGGGAYYTKVEFDAFFEGEASGKKQVHWDRVTSKPSTFTPSAHVLVGAKHTASGLTVGHVVRASGATAFSWAQLQHSDLGNVTENQHHNKLHSMTGVQHSAAGLTVGHVLRATAADAFAWGFLTKLGTINTGVWQGTPIANAYVAGIDQDLLQASSPTFAELTISGLAQIAAYNYISSLYSGTDNVWGYNCKKHPSDGTKLKSISGTASVHPQAIIAGPSEGIRFLTMASNPGADADIVIATYERMRITPGGWVGIAKVPTCELDVNGTIKATQFYLNLGGLLDVNLGSLEEGETLGYDQGTAKWIDIWGVEYDNPRLVWKMYTDFFKAHNDANDPWTGASISSGLLSSSPGNADHPGIVRLSATASFTGGYRFMTSVDCIVLDGRESSEFIFKTIGDFTQIYVRLGFQDSLVSAVPTDGAYINMSEATLTGKTRNSGSESTTGTSYTLAINTWYRAKIAVNDDADEIIFILYSAGGNQLWSNTLSTNIPTAPTGHGVVAYMGGAGNEDNHLIYLDMMIASRAGTIIR